MGRVLIALKKLVIILTPSEKQNVSPISSSTRLLPCLFTCDLTKQISQDENLNIREACLRSHKEVVCVWGGGKVGGEIHKCSDSSFYTRSKCTEFFKKLIFLERIRAIVGRKPTLLQ